MDPQSRNVFAETAYMCLNEEPSQRPSIGEIVTRLENALKLHLEHRKTDHFIAAAEVEGTSSGHDKGSMNFVSTRVVSGKKTMSSRKDLSHLKLSMQDMKSTTNGFAPENIIRESSRRIIYTGRLLHPEQFDIIGKVLLSDSAKDESKTFWTEILMLSSLKHKNLVSLIGFYDEEGEKTIIYKREANESLSKHLSNQTLRWMQRLKICVGVANAMSYIHYDAGRDFSVLHCNIKSSKILLDDQWEPKLSGFELSLKNTLARRHRLLLTCDIVKNVYLDPKYKKTGGLTHKSDVYSLGVVLFEVLCGRILVLRDEDELGEGLLSQLTKSHLDDMIDPHLKGQMDAESLKIFSETAFCCIKKERADRPYIDQVVKGLEKALKLQSIYENPELPRNAVDGASSSHLKWKNLEHLKIALNDIELATKNFSDTYHIGSGAFGMVYKAQLKHFDSNNSSSIDGENKCGFHKKQSTVAIKCIKSPKGEQGFNVEIETLTSCEHENIISLLGFCDEGPDHMILVYELASKGSLEDYLGNSDKMINLTWMRRLKICLDIAHGLNYIHTNTDQEKQKIIHRDIKSANILLGDNWGQRIAFRPSPKFTQQIKRPALSISIRLQILTGRVAYDRTFTDIDSMGIAPIARYHCEKGTIMDVVDLKIKEETDEHVFSLSKGPNEESLDIFAKIAFQCLAMTQNKRPSIDDVIDELKKALYCQRKNYCQEYASRGGLDKYLSDDSLTWVMRLKICIDIAIGLEFLHGTVSSPEMDVDYVIDNVTGTTGYCDPLYSKTGFLTKESDIFSLGAVLFDILCGKLSSEKVDDEYLYLPFLAKQHYHLGKTWDYEKWEPKLPKDYKEIIQMSKCPEIYSTRKKEELYNTFTKGILQQDKVLLSFDADGERNKLVSATTFTYVNSCPHWWRSLKESRFEKVAEMSDISNLNIEIKTDTQLLSPNIVYGEGERNSTSVFCNTEAKPGGGLMIELYRFLNQNEDVVFKFLLENFLSYYCVDGAIYVEGIEFRAIGKVKHDEIGYLKDVQQVLISNFNMDQVQQLPSEEVFEIHKNYDELFWLGVVNGKKLLVLSAKAALYKFSDVDLFTSNPSTQS
ncbi:kinase-like domain, phloem protein 2-like protein, partial [Tanacetum coccineum]